MVSPEMRMRNSRCWVSGMWLWLMLLGALHHVAVGMVLQHGQNNKGDLEIHKRDVEYVMPPYGPPYGPPNGPPYPPLYPPPYPPSNGISLPIRLVDGEDECSGRLEVFYNGSWGTVCDDSWDITDASVVCQQLQCGIPRVPERPGTFKPGTGLILMDDVECNNRSLELASCPHSGWGKHNCDHQEDVGVSCIDPVRWSKDLEFTTPWPTADGPSNGDIRLVDGAHECEGRVEIFNNGVWGTVCDDGWDMNDARVVCRQLECGDATAAHGSAYYPGGSGNIHLDNVRCFGNEVRVDTCQHLGWNVHNCFHHEDAGVSCVLPLTEESSGTDVTTATNQVTVTNNANTPTPAASTTTTSSPTTTSSANTNTIITATPTAAATSAPTSIASATTDPSTIASTTPSESTTIASTTTSESNTIVSTATSDPTTTASTTPSESTISTFTTASESTTTASTTASESTTITSTTTTDQTTTTLTTSTSATTTPASTTTSDPTTTTSTTTTESTTPASTTTSNPTTTTFTTTSDPPTTTFTTTSEPTTTTSTTTSDPPTTTFTTTSDPPTTTFTTTSEPTTTTSTTTSDPPTTTFTTTSDPPTTTRSSHRSMTTSTTTSDPPTTTSTTTSDPPTTTFTTTSDPPTTTFTTTSEPTTTTSTTTSDPPTTTFTTTSEPTTTTSTTTSDPTTTSESTTITLTTTSDPTITTSTTTSDPTTITLTTTSEPTTSTTAPSETTTITSATSSGQISTSSATTIVSSNPTTITTTIAPTTTIITTTTSAATTTIASTTTATSTTTSAYATTGQFGSGRDFPVTTTPISTTTTTTAAATTTAEAPLPIRLSNGDHRCMGRLEIQVGSIWGTVCDDAPWRMTGAQVVCAQLECGVALNATIRAYFGYGSGPIFLDNVDCEGDEIGLSKCRSSKIGKHNCGHHEDAGVICILPEDSSSSEERSLQISGGLIPQPVTTAPPTTAPLAVTEGTSASPVELTTNEATTAPPNTPPPSETLRLVGGSHSCEGRVELYLDDTWGTVCDDAWDLKDAQVVCRQMGCGPAVKATQQPMFGEGTGRVHLDNLKCNGIEISLVHCNHITWSSHNCDDHSEDAGVICLPL